MLTTERHHLILQQLHANGIVKVQELVNQLQTSESTIRRDLVILEKEQKLRRVHGGASLIRKRKDEPSMGEKSIENLEEKTSIAKYAASLIEARDCVFLDAGSTVYQMLPYIEAEHITVVTNGLNHLRALLEKGVDTYLLGGFIKPRTEATIGQTAINNLKQFQFDKVFIGVNGMHKEVGYTTPDPEEASIKALAMKQSRDAFVVADYSKIAVTTFTKIAELAAATIITDNKARNYVNEWKDTTKVEVVTL